MYYDVNRFIQVGGHKQYQKVSFYVVKQLDITKIIIS